MAISVRQVAATANPILDGTGRLGVFHRPDDATKITILV